MRYFPIVLAVSLAVLTGCAKENLTKQTMVTMPDAIRTAEGFVPGSIARASHLEREGDATVYEIEVIDKEDKTNKVWVDARTGRIVKLDN